LQRPEYAAIPVSNLTDAGHHGWSRLVGRVVDIHNTPKSVYLVFSSQLEARIWNANGCPCFLMLMTILGKTVEVRGWLSNQQKAFFTINPSPQCD